MSESHGSLRGYKIAVCGKLKNRTHDDIVSEINRLGGVGVKNRLPDDALCVICTLEAAKTNKTAQEATTRGVPVVQLQWLDDGGLPANLKQYLISQHTPPQQTADPSKPETPETRSGMDRYEGNAESAESTPTRKPSTWTGMLNNAANAFKSVTGTPSKTSTAAPPAGEASGSSDGHAPERKETSEAEGPGPIDSGTGPRVDLEDRHEDPLSPTETASFRSVSDQDEGSTNENPVLLSSKSPDNHREGTTQSNPIPVSSASPETEDGSRREGSTESNPIHVSSESPEPPGTVHETPVLKQESRDDRGQQPYSGDDEEEYGRQKSHEPQGAPEQDSPSQGQGPSKSPNRLPEPPGESDKENQEPDLYGSTPVVKTHQPAKQGDSTSKRQKNQTDYVLQEQSKTSRDKQPESGRVFQSTESNEGVHQEQVKAPGSLPPKPALVHSHDQSQSVKGLQSPDSATTVVRDDAFNPYKWAETHTFGNDQMERHPRFSNWKDFPHPKTGLWMEIDDFEHADRKIWVLARGITYKNQLAVESIGFRDGQSRGLSLSAAAYKSEIAALRRKGIGQFPPGDPKDFTGLKGRSRWGDGQQNPFNVVFFAEAHGEKNNGDCLAVYDGGKAMSKTDVVKAGGSKWGRLIESHRRPEISVAPGKVLWPDESMTKAAASTGIPPATRLASWPPILPTPKSVQQPRFVQQPPQGVPRSSTERTHVASPPVNSFYSMPAAAATAPMGFPPAVIPPPISSSMNMTQGFQQPAYRQFPGPQNHIPPQMGWLPQDFASYQQQAAPFYVLPASQSAYSTRDVSMDPGSSFRGPSQPPVAFQPAAEPVNLKPRGPATLHQSVNGDWYLNTSKVTFPDGRVPNRAGYVGWETDGSNEYVRTNEGQLWRVALIVNP